MVPSMDVKDNDFIDETRGLVLPFICFFTWYVPIVRHQVDVNYAFSHTYIVYLFITSQ